MFWLSTTGCDQGSRAEDETQDLQSNVTEVHHMTDNPNVPLRKHSLISVDINHAFHPIPCLTQMTRTPFSMARTPPGPAKYVGKAAVAGGQPLSKAEEPGPDVTPPCQAD